jgi:antirestriction protein ArdC
MMGHFQSGSELCANVRNGQKATKIALWKPVSRKRVDQNGEEVKDSFFMTGSTPIKLA